MGHHGAGAGSEHSGAGVTDRVEKFIEEFGLAIDASRSHATDSALINAAAREAAQLAETLERLSQRQGALSSVSAADLRSLQEELSSLRQTPSLEGLLTNGRALLQVVEDGIIDGDANRLRSLLTEAESLSGPRNRSRAPGQIHLEVPAKARCVECDDLLVGRRQPALNWNAITKVIRDHERDRHGGYSEELRDELSQGLRRLREGDAIVTAGRYKIGVL